MEKYRERRSRNLSGLTTDYRQKGRKIMKYEVLYRDSFPLVRCDLEQGERIKAESDAMVAMSPTLDVEGKMEGGILSGIARSLLAGEKFFFQEIIAKRGPGYVLFAHALPGGIVPVELDGSYSLRVQKDGFLAATQNIKIDTKMQNLSKGLFSGEGFFIVNISGSGTVFLSSYGAIHAVDIPEGEEMVIDNGHLVAWPEYMPYEIKKASSGWFSSMTSGEGLVCRFKGPGRVLIQTRNPGAFQSWIQSLLPSKSSD